MENKIFIKKETMKGIADAIRAKDGTTEEIAVTDMAERIGAINSGVNYLEECVSFRIWSLNVFGTPKVELMLKKAEQLDNAFSVNSVTTDTEGRTNTTVEELIIHCPNTITAMKHAFGQNNFHVDQKLKRITLDFQNKATNWSNAFDNLRALEVIDGVAIDLSYMTGDGYAASMFWQCIALREVRFSGLLAVSINMRHSVDFSKDSIISLMACCSPEVSGKTLTFNKAAVDKAFETSSDAADGSTSTEWAELIATKPNWTISLA